MPDYLYWSSFQCKFVPSVASDILCGVQFIFSIRFGCYHQHFSPTHTHSLQIKQEWLMHLKLLETNLKRWWRWFVMEDLHKIKDASAPNCRKNLIWNCLHVFSVHVCFCLCVCVCVCAQISLCQTTCLYCMWEEKSVCTPVCWEPRFHSSPALQPRNKVRGKLFAWCLLMMMINDL